LPPAGNFRVAGWPTAVLVTPSHDRDAEIDPSPTSIGSRVEEPVLTILVGGVTKPADADAGRSATPAPWPPLDLFESWRSLLVRIDVPGIKTSDLEVAFAGGLLVVSGARYLTAGPDGERFHRLERPAGSFRRSLALPTAATADMVHASVDDGVLTVVVPKLAPTASSGVAVQPTPLEVARRQQPDSSCRDVRESCDASTGRPMQADRRGVFGSRWGE
jgi:HSP20 family molecular chaperone IbpA